MRGLRFVLFIIVAGLYGLSCSAQGSLRDQGQIFGTGGDLDLETEEWSQSITTGISGKLTEIMIQFHNGVPFQAPALNLSIFDGDNPISGSALFTERLFVMGTDLNYDNTFTWDLGSAYLPFNVGDVFSFVLQAEGLGYNIAGNDPPGYYGGYLLKNRVDLPELSDIAFITFMTPVTLPDAEWFEDFDSEQIDFVENAYFTVSEGRLHFTGDLVLTEPEGTTWNGGDAQSSGWPQPGDSNYFENFVVSVDTFWKDRSQEDGYGIFTSLLGTDDPMVPRSNVTFSINKEGEYLVTKKRDDFSATVVGWSESSLLSLDGQNNKLSIKKVGPYYYFYVDEVEVERRIIDGFPGGGIGLYSLHTVDVSFDNFSVGPISYNDFEDDSNNVLEDFTFGSGGFSESEYFTVQSDTLLFEGDGTDNLLFHIWSGGFDPGGWSPSTENTNYFGNFTLSIETFWDGGDVDYAYGIIACTKENTAGFEDSIRFWVTQSGFYLIGTIVDTNWETLVDWTESNLITPDGISTKLSIQKDGNQFHFSIGDTIVQSLTINGLPGGGVGVEASQHVNVSFDNFSIVQPGTPPIADAGGDHSFTAGTAVELDGSNSSDDIGIASYRWYQLTGPQVVLSNPTISQPTFTAPSVEDPKITLAFQLKVTDDDRLHDSDITVVEVRCANVIGDVDGNCLLGLGDGIVSLQVASGKPTTNVRSDYVSSGVDVDGNDKAGSEEAIHAIKNAAGIE